jgi:hypothetical protein
MNAAATKIQRAFRRKLEGRTMIMHIKDVMKRLVEAEKAKARLGEMLVNMHDETERCWHKYIAKNVEKVVKIQAYVRGRRIRKHFGKIIRRGQVLTKIVKKLVEENHLRMGKGFLAFRSLVYDKDGKKINIKAKKGAGGKNKHGYKKPEDKRTSNN